jgi:hypothetical protein
MQHPDIKAWLALYDEHTRLERRLEKTEEEVAEAWAKTLSPEQLKVFEALLMSHRGFRHLHVKMIRRRIDEDDEEIGFGKREE